MDDTQPMAADNPGPADMVEIYYAPTAVFERRREGGFGLPLLVLVAVAAVLVFATSSLMRPIVDAEMARGFAAVARKSPQLTPEQIDRMKAMGGGSTATIGAIVYFLVGPLIVGFLLWIVGKIVGARQELTAAMTVGVFAFYPRLIELVVNAAQAAVLPESALNGRFRVSVGIGRFLDPDQAILPLALLGRVDVFTIWVTVLLAIGLKVTGRATTGQAAIAGVLMWIIGALPPLLGAMRAA